MAGQSSHKRRPFLWRHPDQQPVDPDCSSLFPEVSFEPFILSPVVDVGHEQKTPNPDSHQEKKEDREDLTEERIKKL